MRKSVLLFAAVFTAFSCNQKWNDLVHEEVPAEIIAFSLEGEKAVQISRATRTVTSTFPEGTDLKALTVKTFQITNGAVLSPSIKAGDVLDLSDTLKVTLSTYDSYLWKIAAVTEKDEEEPGNGTGEDGKEEGQEPPQLKDGPQLYNLKFDFWSKKNTLPVPYETYATDEEKAVWGNADEIIALLGFPTMRNETEFVAVPGEGKAALRLQTQGIAAMKKLAAGSLFTGKMDGVDFLKMSAKLRWGVPFTHRPAVLEGYVCSQPKPIDYAEGPHADKLGEMDKAAVVVMLTDWIEPFEVSPPDKLVDVENDPHIIGYGKMLFDREMTGYEKFRLEISYRNDRTPRMITIVTTSSYLGDYFTGGSGSVVYFDEFQLLYN